MCSDNIVIITSRNVRIVRRGGLNALKIRNLSLSCPFRARIYTAFISPKKHSPLHKLSVSYWLSAGNCVKVWISNHSRLPSKFLSTFSVQNTSRVGVNAWNRNPSQQTRDWRGSVKAWIPNPSHSKSMKINRKHALCERVNAFSGKKYVYIRRVNTWIFNPSQQVLQASVIFPDFGWPFFRYFLLLVYCFLRQLWRVDESRLHLSRYPLLLLQILSQQRLHIG